MPIAGADSPSIMVRKVRARQINFMRRHTASCEKVSRPWLKCRRQRRLGDSRLAIGRAIIGVVYQCWADGCCDADTSPNGAVLAAPAAVYSS